MLLTSLSPQIVKLSLQTSRAVAEFGDKFSPATVVADTVASVDRA